MIKNWFITGDTHGRVASRLSMITSTPEETAVIILGDSGINFYLNKTDLKNKKIINNTGFTIYCVRGNHEERPENLNIPTQWDPEVQNMVYVEPEFPNIRYLLDGEDYIFNGHKTLVIGGAYSVDKWYRLEGCAPDAKWTGWFKDEQLTEAERNNIFTSCAGESYDLVLTHTCPISWEPTDLFLTGINQQTVDKTMELWLEELKSTISWKVWLFGHYHADRLERPGVEMYFNYIEDLEVIWDRWTNNHVEWYMVKSPNYWME